MHGIQVIIEVFPSTPVILTLTLSYSNCLTVIESKMKRIPVVVGSRSLPVRVLIDLVSDCDIGSSKWQLRYLLLQQLDILVSKLQNCTCVIAQSSWCVLAFSFGYDRG